MAGAWPGGQQWGRALAYQIQTPTAGSPAFAKGAWVQLSAATPTDSTWAQFMLRSAGTPSAASAVDIGIGAAGSETVVIADLISSGVGVRLVDYLLPWHVAAGTRVAARASASAAAEGVAVQFMTWDDTYHGGNAAAAVDTYGFQAASCLGTLIDPGATANAKSAYVEITPGLSADLAGLIMAFDNQSDLTSGTVGQIYWLLDLAVGAAGAEQIILPNYSLCGYSTSTIAMVLNMVSPYIPLAIPAGSRIAARAQCSSGTSPDRRLGLTLYGVRQ
jgi:hypothetical protein